MRRTCVATCGLLIVLMAMAHPAHAQTLAALDEGYRAMYNLQFARAHDIFRQWQKEHPDDPVAPASDAAAYLFSEFDRLHVLEVELFVDDNKFERRTQATPDAAARQGFESRLAQATEVANRVLARDAANADALFTLAMVDGLRADYIALIERRDLAALTYVKQGRVTAEKLLASHSNYYDGYLALGVENYLLSLKPAPLRWLLRMTGAQTDKQIGIEKLQITADKGRYLLPYARLLLAVAALRDGDRARGVQLLRWLAAQFPQNHLYTRELSKVEAGAGASRGAP